MLNKNSKLNRSLIRQSLSRQARRNQTGLIQKGSSLIEVLVSTLVISIGLLGTIGLQTRSMQINQGAMYQIQASILAEDFADRMRSNSDFVHLYRLGFSDSTPSYNNCEAIDAECTPTQMASYDIGTWKENLSNILPSGKARVVNVPPGNEYIISIEYDDKRLELSSTHGQTQNSAALKMINFRTVI